MNTNASSLRFAIPQPVIPTLPVTGTDTVFPIRRIYCVGRNYAAHAIEMGHDPDRELPFFFQKNPDNILFGRDFPYPPLSSDVHFEVELIVALKDGGSNIAVGDAMDKIFGYGVGVDFTRRDLQAEAKSRGARGRLQRHSNIPLRYRPLFLRSKSLHWQRNGSGSRRTAQSSRTVISTT